MLLLSGVAIGIFFIVIATKPISVIIVNNNQDQSFTWGDTVDLQAVLTNGHKPIVSYKWELVPIANSTILLESIFIKNEGSNLKLTIDNDKYFEIGAFKVHASYSGSLFTKTSEISLPLFKISNQTQFIDSTIVQSWNSTTGVLILKGSSNVSVGDILVQENSFMVTITNIISVQDQLYTYQVKNSSFSDAFSFLNLGGELELDDGTNSTSVELAKNQIQQQQQDHKQQRSLLEVQDNSSNDNMNFDLKFSPLKNGGLTFLLNNNPNSSFYLSTESTMTVSCTNPVMTSVVSSNNFGSQSFKVSCEYDINFTGRIDIPNNYEMEYTYWLYGGDNDKSSAILNADHINKTTPDSLVSETNSLGGLLSKGKIFKLAWKGLKGGAKKLLKQFLEIKVPLRFKLKTQTDGALLNFSLKIRNSISFEYEYTPSGGIQVVPTSPINWEALNLDPVFAADSSTKSCSSEIDISVGVGLYHSFALGLAEAGGEFLIHAPLWNSYTNQYNGTSHGLVIPGVCTAGYRPETTIVGFTVALEVGLQIWKFGLSKSIPLLDFGNKLLSWTCAKAPCTLQYTRYSCSTGGIFSKPECYEDRNGKYMGLSECKTNCGGCNACPNPNCCNCPGAIVYPCPGSCSFACPGDFGACCLS
ncbi:hypothetical protein CYY_002949 [Polysphondylium violaceum]|uniref:Uncharacterized protein n=1 Tax=Polysphondylium violaceum TaxID=133409 RepID=A0A8J4V6E8_9MYCE|nr:hypothetical protein CYY_002949 [Polysphondylium violaceum]